MPDVERRTKLYRMLLGVYPARFRSEFEEVMTQMVLDRVEAEGSSARLWMHLFADLFRSALAERLRHLWRSLRAKPLPLGGLLLAGGAALGGATATVGALGGGLVPGPSGPAESSVWLVVAYGIILLALLGSVVAVGPRTPPLIGFGTLLVAVGQLSVMSHEVQVMNVELSWPSMGAASAFPLMLGAAVIAVGMSKSSKWSKVHAWSMLAVAVYPLVLVFGAYPVVVHATGSEVSADLLFKAGYMIVWVLVGAAFLLVTSPSPQPSDEGRA